MPGHQIIIAINIIIISVIKLLFPSAHFDFISILGFLFVNQNREITWRHRNWLVANNEWIGTGSSELGSGFKWGESTHP